VWGLLKAEMQMGVEVIYPPAVSRRHSDLLTFLGRLAKTLAINPLNKVFGNINQNRVRDWIIPSTLALAGQRHGMSPSG
jgi:hypothetical protein